ncbi:MAG: hypothetical protein AABY22_15095, partial [Nanoarchaeota archaeon]
MFDKIKLEFKDRFYNVGSDEFFLLGLSIGLALQGKIPICYSITPFLIFRPIELLRLYLDYEKIPVKLISSGRDKDYLHDGISHWAHDVKPHLDLFPNIKQYWPETKEEINSEYIKEFLNNDKPCFLSLKR